MVLITQIRVNLIDSLNKTEAKTRKTFAWTTASW